MTEVKSAQEKLTILYQKCPTQFLYNYGVNGLIFGLSKHLIGEGCKVDGIPKFMGYHIVAIDCIDDVCCLIMPNL